MLLCAGMILIGVDKEVSLRLPSALCLSISLSSEGAILVPDDPEGYQTKDCPAMRKAFVRHADGSVTSMAAVARWSILQFAFANCLNDHHRRRPGSLSVLACSRSTFHLEDDVCFCWRCVHLGPNFERWLPGSTTSDWRFATFSNEASDSAL